MPASIAPASAKVPARPAMTRAKAAALHLGLSGVVAALAALVVFVVWYPTPYRAISGGRELFMLVVGIDVLLGPLITLTVFDTRKPRQALRRDLAIVAILQTAALVYGMHTVFVARPVYLVFEVDRFRVVRAADVDASQLEQATPAYRRLPYFGPELLAARIPTDPQEKMRSISLALEGLDIGLRPEMWQAYDLAREQVAQRAAPLAALRSKAERAAAVESAVGACRRPIEQLATVPIVARVSTWSAVVDRSSAAVCAYLPFGGFDSP